MFPDWSIWQSDDQNASVDVLAGITGFAVEGVNGSLGRVAEVRGGGGGAFVIVRRPSGREQLLPMGVIEEIDVAEKRVCVYRSTREVDSAPSDEAGIVRHYAPWGAGHRVLPAERSRQLITHIVERAEWETAAGRAEYRPASLAELGFVHASTAYSVLLPANIFYRGRPGLVLLAIDQQRLRSEIRWEEPQPTVEAFPHNYGVALEPFDPGPDGSFELPLAIRELADAYATRA